MQFLREVSGGGSPLACPSPAALYASCGRRRRCHGSDKAHRGIDQEGQRSAGGSVRPSRYAHVQHDAGGAAAQEQCSAGPELSASQLGRGSAEDARDGREGRQGERPRRSLRRISQDGKVSVCARACYHCGSGGAGGERWRCWARLRARAARRGTGSLPTGSAARHGILQPHSCTQKSNVLTQQALRISVPQPPQRHPRAQGLQGADLGTHKEPRILHVRRPQGKGRASHTASQGDREAAAGA